MNEERRRAIVVNDDPAQLRLTAGLLQKMGLEVRSYSESEQALEELRNLPVQDLVVVDLHMPVIDGWRFCRLLRSQEYARYNRVPVLVVSATFSGSDVEAVTQELGANAFLPVPYEPGTLQEYVTELLAGRRPQYRYKVLVIEDDEAVRRVLRRAFAGAGYEVLEAASGREGHSTFRRIRPDVVILDYHLPDFNGDSFLEAVRRPGDSTVCIAITGDDDPRLAFDLMRKGADGYVRKPFDPSFLVELAGKARRERALLRVEEILEARTRELQASEARYRSLFGLIPESILVLDPEGQVLEANETARKALEGPGRELAGASILQLVEPHQRGELRKNLHGAWDGQASSFSLELRDRMGTPRFYAVHAQPGDYQGRPTLLCVCRDETDRRRQEEDRRRMENEIREAQKLESLGVLAGGVAHDFNNLLVGVLGNASLALLDLEPGHPMRPLIEEIEVAAKTAAELTSQILTYAGKAEVSMGPVRLETLVREIVQLVSHTVSKKADLEIRIPQEIPEIRGDSAQLRQVLMNLIINASDALEGQSGSIRLRARAVHLDHPQIPGNILADEVVPGTFVAVSVQDTGSGMSADTLNKIFVPFFSTKRSGRGLGLAATLGIVRGHGGAITVDTAPGKGSTFEVYLPVAASSTSGRPRLVGKDEGAAPGEALEEPRTPETGPGAGSPEAPPLGRTGPRPGILVVDDESAVRRLARLSLERIGFDVLEAADGGEGLEMAVHLQHRIQAILLDVTMPGLSGHEVLEEMGRMGIDLPVILSSGYSRETVDTAGLPPMVVGFLPKPYAPAALQEMVRRTEGYGREDLPGLAASAG